MDKKVSVIMPMYNAEKHLERSLGSILKQSYKNLEIIIVNDGSTDDSQSIVEGYMANDCRIKLYNDTNHGVSHARNVGLTKVTGDYVQFIDADDDLDLDYFKIQLQRMEESGAEVAVCNNSNHPFFFTHLTDRVYDMHDHDDFLEFYQHTFAPTFPWNKLYKREVVDGLFFAENLAFAEDEAFFCTTLSRINKIVSTKEYLYHYYLASKQNGGEQTSTINSFLKASKFWVTHTSFYYKELECLPYKLTAFESAIREKKIPVKSVNDVIYQRVFDYTFYQYAAYCGFEIPEDALYSEMMNIFQNTFFQMSVNVQEQYGLKFRSFLDKDLKEYVYKLNHAMYTMFVKAFTEKPEGVLPTLVSVMLFAYYFVLENNQMDNVNVLNKLHKEFLDNKTPNAKFAHQILASLEK